MSDLNNPLFDNQREFLERQKEEYKNALMGDVDQIKNQGQEIGKKAAIVGGVIFAGYLVKRMFSGGKKKEKKEKKNKKHAAPLHETPYGEMNGTSFSDYDSYVHEQEDGYTLSSERMHHEHPEEPVKVKEPRKPFMKSPLAKVLTTQAVTMLLVFAGKKLEEYLNSVSENNDIAEKPLVVTEIETTEYIIPEKDALQ